MITSSNKIRGNEILIGQHEYCNSIHGTRHGLTATRYHPCEALPFNSSDIPSAIWKLNAGSLARVSGGPPRVDRNPDQSAEFLRRSLLSRPRGPAVGCTMQFDIWRTQDRCIHTWSFRFKADNEGVLFGCAVDHDDKSLEVT